jgi:hypothetical protein
MVKSLINYSNVVYNLNYDENKTAIAGIDIERPK